MPSIRVVGRHWNVSSDDLPLPAAFGVVFHISWCIIVFSAFQDVVLGVRTSCTAAAHQSAYIISLFFCFLATAGIELGVAIEGCKGSIFEESRRARMPHLIVAHLVASLTTVAVNCWGTWTRYNGSEDCVEWPDPWETGSRITALVWSTWAILICSAIFVLLPLQLLPAEDERVHHYRVWHCRWSFLAVCCCRRQQLMRASAGERQPLERLAELFHQVFRHADFTTSDVAATLWLASCLQRLDRRSAVLAALRDTFGPPASKHSDARVDVAALRDTAISQTGEQHGGAPVGTRRLLTASHIAREAYPDVPVDRLCAAYCEPGKPVDAAALDEAAHYAPFAMAAYGALFYAYRQFQQLQLPARPGRAAAACLLRCCSCCRDGARQVMDTYSLSAASEAAFGPSGVASPPGSPASAAPGAGGARHRPQRRAPLPLALTMRQAVKAITGVRSRDIAHVHTVDRFNEECPYYLALDHATQSLVLAIRGTLSLDDTLTDLMCYPEPFGPWTRALAEREPACPAVPPAALGSTASGRGGSAAAVADESAAGHSGVMRLAAALVADLARHRKLFALLAPAGPPGAAAAAAPADGSTVLSGSTSSQPVNDGIPTPRSQDNLLPMDSSATVASQDVLDALSVGGWRLVVTGHSLGAGVAAFVGMHLRTLYRRVHVFCYSPPGWLLTPSLAAHTEAFVTSVVINKDFVPRLTLRSLEALRDDLVHAGVRCRHSKVHVALRGLGRKLCPCCVPPLSWPQLAAMFASADEEATPAARTFLHRYRSSVAAHMSDGEFQTLQTFQLPGRVLFIRNTKAHKAATLRHQQLQALWVTAAALQSEGLLLSRHMLLDHFPDRALDVIRLAAARRGGRHDSAPPPPPPSRQPSGAPPPVRHIIAAPRAEGGQPPAGLDAPRALCGPATDTAARRNRSGLGARGPVPGAAQGPPSPPRPPPPQRGGDVRSRRPVSTAELGGRTA